MHVKIKVMYGSCIEIDTQCSTTIRSILAQIMTESYEAQKCQDTWEAQEASTVSLRTFFISVPSFSSIDSKPNTWVPSTLMSALVSVVSRWASCPQKPNISASFLWFSPVTVSGHRDKVAAGSKLYVRAYSSCSVPGNEIQIVNPKSPISR